MPRIGMNPSRGQKSEYRPARVTLAMLTYLPEEAGYFAHRFDVTRLCLESLIANTPEPYDLLVFDNGSCPRLVEYLREMHVTGKIHYLILSGRNIGKIGALKVIFNAAPGEIVAYTDDDVFFLPGWLDEHLKILGIFPQTGLVTGFYIRDHVIYGMKSVEAFAQRPDVTVERGLFWEQEWIRHYVENMGRTVEGYAEETKGQQDVILHFQGAQVYASAGHHQFVAPRQVMLAALPKEWDPLLMGKMVHLENKIDEMGFLRLSTRQPVTRLLGNTINDENAALARTFAIEASAAHVRTSGGALQKIYRLGPVQSLVRRVYNWMFRILNAK
jgi:glycosyltransferase involved in cell wall biosynthesis